MDKIAPINQLERKIITHPEWLEGAAWGKPRKGHPEGEVVHHVVEVLENVELLRPFCTEQDYFNLRFITLIHDTFKYQVDRNQPKVGANHHGSLARVFAEKFTEDPIVLAVIHHHDHSYNIWRAYANFPMERDMRLLQFAEKQQSIIQLLYWFYWCDNNTGNKTQEPFEWFESSLEPQLELIPKELETSNPTEQ